MVVAGRPVVGVSLRRGCHRGRFPLACNDHQLLSLPSFTMRLPLLSAAVVLLPVSSLAAQLLAPQVYLHPSPHDGQTASPPALSDDEAHTVIAHHLGATKGHLLPALGDWVHMLTGSAAVAPESAKPKILVVQGVVDADGESCLLSFR